MMRLILLATTILSLLVSPSVMAQDQSAIVDDLQANACAGSNSPDCGFLPDDPISNGATLEDVLASVFTVSAALSLIFIVVGGLRYVISDGNEQRVKQAKETIIYAIVGLVVSLSAFAIVRFILGSIL